MCPDIDYLTRQCGSRECIRRPNDGERCPQCIMNCSGQYKYTTTPVNYIYDNGVMYSIVIGINVVST